jgi:hypothetical protein
MNGLTHLARHGSVKTTLLSERCRFLEFDNDYTDTDAADAHADAVTTGS